MTFDNSQAIKHLRAGDLRALFIEVLGWDIPKSGKATEIEVNGKIHQLSTIAEKRGVRIFQCKDIPCRGTRHKIDRQTIELSYEHLIIFVDNERQLWQWVSRESGKVNKFREHVWRTSQSPDPLIQKLRHITFNLDEEETLTLVGATSRIKKAFDISEINTGFYNSFKANHTGLIEKIKGLSKVDKAWYASIMLNRLMFVYFIQKKQLLDGNINYLNNRLRKVKEEHGDDKFHSFYRAFLLKLFHGGLATPVEKRDSEINSLIGNIPYLNGGLFEQHILESEVNGIQIPDKAFEEIFTFFDQYDWTLDKREIDRADGKQINPDVLGYIFEKYINQKQMGAYYTKDDITEYISKNTIIPWVFRNVQAFSMKGFDSNRHLWEQLAENVSLYVYSINEGDGEVANDDALAANRKKSEFVETLLKNGSICIEDLITHNLNIRQLALDIIQFSDQPNLVLAFWTGITSVKILDPACGSGAFLFAALGVLYDLYDVCLERMEQFVNVASRVDEDTPEVYSKFSNVLNEVSQQPNRDYYIFKSIIISNLYGVDIMLEAAEICKLRLFLKLAAQLDDSKEIEPLPDMDFNIRAGNSILGFRSIPDAMEKTQNQGLQFSSDLNDIQNEANKISESLGKFRQQQTKVGGCISFDEKKFIREKIGSLKERLDSVFIKMYAPKPFNNADKDKSNKAWLNSQNLFHWVVDFHDIVSDGGFQIIVGNPPYVNIDKSMSRKALLDEYRTCLPAWGNDEDLYTMFVERSLSILDKNNGAVGLILPLSVTFSIKKPFVELRKVISEESGVWHWSNFDRIPAALFGNDVRTRCSIGLMQRDRNRQHKMFYTTSLNRWTNDERSMLFKRLCYAGYSGDVIHQIPRVDDSGQANLLEKLLSFKRPLKLDLSMSRSIPHSQLKEMNPNFPNSCLFIGKTAYNWFPAWRSMPRSTDVGGKLVPANAMCYKFANEDKANFAFALLCSSLGYWWWAVASDGFNIPKWLVETFPISSHVFSVDQQVAISKLGNRLKSELKNHYVYKDNKGRKGNYDIRKCFSLTSQIDDEMFRSLPGVDSNLLRGVREFNSCFSRLKEGE